MSCMVLKSIRTDPSAEEHPFGLLRRFRRGSLVISLDTPFTSIMIYVCEWQTKVRFVPTHDEVSAMS